MQLLKSIASCLALSLASLATEAVQVDSVKLPVVLNDLPFEIEVDITYSTQDLDPTTQLNFLVSFEDGTLIKNSTQSAWDNDGQLKTLFTVDDLLIVGPGRAVLNVTATASTDPSDSSGWGTASVVVVPQGVSVIPLIVTLVLAAMTKSVVISIVTGLWIAAMIEFQDIVEATVHMVDIYVLESITDPGHASIIMFTMFLGGILSMMTRSGGAAGLAKFFGKFVDSARKAQLVTLTAGLCVFFDDYACLLLTGSTMRPITDAQFVSREKLAFIVDSIAAPMAALVPISSWTAFESILIETEADKLAGQGIDLKALGFETSGFLGFLRLVPYMYYPIFLVVFQLTVMLTELEFGPMLSAERRARYRHVLIDEDDEAEEERVILADDDPETLPTPNTPKLLVNALLPIAMMISITVGAMVGIGLRNIPQNDPEASSNLFAYTDGVLALLYSTSVTCFFQVAMYRVQFRPRFNRKLVNQPIGERWLFPTSVLVEKFKRLIGKDNFDETYANAEPILGAREAVEVWLHGVKTMAPSVVVLVLAWSIGGAMDRIGVGRYLASEVSGTLSPASLPALSFILCSGVSVATGSSFGTMALMFPIVSPLAFTVGQGDPERYYASLSGILAGSVYGSHISPISDTTILSSMSCRCDLQKHVITQFPYATLCAFWAIVIGYVPSGLGTLPPVATNLLGILFIVLSVLILGAPVSSPRGRLDILTYLWSMFRWKILRHNPADVEALRLQMIVIKEEGDKDDVVGQGMKRDYLIWAMRRSFESSRFGEHELQREHVRTSRKSHKQQNQVESHGPPPTLADAKTYDVAVTNADASVVNVAATNDPM